jgi:hypothetical protein
MGLFDKRPNDLPDPHYRAVQLLVHHGREVEGRALVDALNKFQRAFGFPDYLMPPPLGPELPNLVAIPAKGAPTRDHT